MCSLMARKRPGGGVVPQTKSPHAAAHGPSSKTPKVMALGSNTVSVKSTRIVPTIPSSSDTSGSKCLAGTCEHLVPVAQMIPIFGTHGVLSCPTILHSNTGEPLLATRNDFRAMESSCQPSETSRSQNLRNGLSYPSPSSKPYPGRPEEMRRHQRKRKRDLGVDADSFLQQFKNGRIHQNRDPDWNMSHSISSNMIPKVANNKDTIVGTASTTESMHTTISDVDMTHAGNSEVDSVTGSPRPSPTVEEQDEASKPTLIVEPKVQRQNQSSLVDSDRLELALNLMNVFEMSGEPPKVLEKVVTLIESIRKADNLLPQSVSGGRHASHQQELDQWLELLNILLRFCKDMESINDQKILNTHGDSLEPTNFFRKHRIPQGARVEVLKWSLQRENHETYEWSNCVTSKLLEMAYRDFGLTKKDSETMRKRLVKFNKRVVEGKLSSLLIRHLDSGPLDTTASENLGMDCPTPHQKRSTPTA